MNIIWVPILATIFAIIGTAIAFVLYILGEYLIKWGVNNDK